MRRAAARQIVGHADRQQARGRGLAGAAGHRLEFRGRERDAVLGKRRQIVLPELEADVAVVILSDQREPLARKLEGDLLHLALRGDQQADEGDQRQHQQQRGEDDDEFDGHHPRLGAQSVAQLSETPAPHQFAPDIAVVLSVPPLCVGTDCGGGGT
ncbi:hypothetical protein SDC9_12895 [bioreactor metagenome]|uniref:Uncharacterized protein n=1 Tax=bioreactor metagenome TaxID=1076179 RepID=A0A644TJX0_9ZZZZ